jgi:hypothetical protein
VRIVLSVVIGVGVLVLTAGPAAADPARPTNVTSHITGIQPPTPQVRAGIMGGNAFVQLHVAAGTTVVVLGYEGEPYLRIAADGTVAENTRSAATYLNRTLRGTVHIPPTVNKDAPPQWQPIGSGGSYAWHDHRVHWMAAGTPPDPVDWQVPLLVNDAKVTIDGRYEGVAAPGSGPWWVVAVVVFALTVALGWQRLRPAAVVTAVVSAIGVPVALAIARLPASGVGDWTGVALLGVAIAAAVVAVLVRRAGPWLAGAGLALVIWAGRRADVLDHAVLVTALPGWLDRFAVAAGIGAGLGAIVVGVRAVMAPAPRRPADAAAT